MGEGRERWRETEKGGMKSEKKKQKIKRDKKEIVQQITSSNWVCNKRETNA